MKLEDKVLDRIDSLGGKLGDISQHAWEALVKYQIVYGIVDIIVGILIIAFISRVRFYFIRRKNKIKKFKKPIDSRFLLLYTESIRNKEVNLWKGLLYFIKKKINTS